MSGGPERCETFGALVAVAVETIEATPRAGGAASAPPPDRVVQRLRQGDGDLDDLDTYREARGWDLRKLLEVLAFQLGLSGAVAQRLAQGADLSTVCAGTEMAPSGFPRLLRHSYYLPFAGTADGAGLLALARAVERELASPAQLLTTHLAGLGADLSAVGNDLEPAVQELRERGALVLGGRVVHQRGQIVRAASALRHVGELLHRGRLE